MGKQTFELLGLLSRSGRLLELNQSALTALGAQREDVIGQFFWEVPWWVHAPELQVQIRDVRNL